MATKALNSGTFGVVLGVTLAMLSMPAMSQTTCPVGGTGISCLPQGDIDLFTNNPTTATDNPNVLFVLDNTANWAGNDQQFPHPDPLVGGTIEQGKAELQSIKDVLLALGNSAANVNVGIMAYPAKETGSAPHGGYIRSAIRPMTDPNKTNFIALLDHMIANVTDSNAERQNSNLPHGNLMADAHNYFKGLAPIAQSDDVAATGAPPSNADPEGYMPGELYTKFKPPAGGGCGRNYIIFIANPNSNGPAPDKVANSSPNTELLQLLGGNEAIQQPPIKQFTVTPDTKTNLGLSAKCYAATAAGATACSTAEKAGTFATQCTSYESCSCDATFANSTNGLPTCVGDDRRYPVNGVAITQSGTNSAPPPGPIVSGPTVNQNTLTQTACIADTAVVTTNTVAGQTECKNGTPNNPQQNCPTGQTCRWANTNVSCGTGGGKTTWNLVYDTTAYTPATAPATATCPASSAVTTGTNPTTTTTTSWTNCYGSGAGVTTGCAANTRKFDLFGTKTVNAYETTTVTTETLTHLGYTYACYASHALCQTNDFQSQAANFNGGLACGASDTATATGTCPSPQLRLQMQGVNTDKDLVATLTNGSFANNEVPLNANLWAQYMHKKAIADTYVINVYNKHVTTNMTSGAELYNSMANLGGGEYFAARNQNAIKLALTEIFNEIQSVNSNFASAALPISATNRAQNVNQVFIGMFRPHADAAPRWHGNLKRYKLMKSDEGDIVLGDKNNEEAVSTGTGFIDDCATSFWTTDSGNYWEPVKNKPLPRGKCDAALTPFSPWSDAPDGPIVEKGATAQVVRKGNGGTAGTVNRNFLTLDVDAGELVPLTTDNSDLSPEAYAFITGHDVDDENFDTNTTEPRASIHGDVIHSRPLPVNYGLPTDDSGEIAVYYGSNDGTYRGIDADTGRELWAFVAPETTSRLNRLANNSPPVLLYGSLLPSDPAVATPTPKDWFFDGSAGIYQPADNENIWIFPTMHRGGRMIYALDVTDRTAPVFKWRAGCPNLDNDSDCFDGPRDPDTVDEMVDMGLTWSYANVASIKGYTSGTTNPPVIIVGGGYDKCHDANTKSLTACSGAKGKAVFILDADDGHLIKKFTTEGSVAGDVSLVDVNNDGLVDFAYAADLSGNLYRIKFVDNTFGALASADWTITKIAYTTGGGRRFMYGPAVLPSKGGVVYLALGTGDREHPLKNQYPYPGAMVGEGVTNKFYMFLDRLPPATPGEPVNLDSTTAMADADIANCDTLPIVSGPGPSGWSMSLTEPGEQVVTSSVIVGGLAAFSTNTPTDPLAGACSSLGKARGYLVNLFTGSGAIGTSKTCGGSKASEFVGGGLPASPVIATVTLDDGTTHTVLLGGAQKDGGTSSTLQAQDMPPPIVPIRKGVYWKSTGDN